MGVVDKRELSYISQKFWQLVLENEFWPMEYGYSLNCLFQVPPLICPKRIIHIIVSLWAAEY
jgi:hypothetical protein